MDPSFHGVDVTAAAWHELSIVRIICLTQGQGLTTCYFSPLVGSVLNNITDLKFSAVEKGQWEEKTKQTKKPQPNSNPKP